MTVACKLSTATPFYKAEMGLRIQLLKSDRYWLLYAVAFDKDVSVGQILAFDAEVSGLCMLKWLVNTCNDTPLRKKRTVYA